MSEPLSDEPDRRIEIPTPLGPARAHLWAPQSSPVGRLLLGHGAGGGIGAPDLIAARRAAVTAGWLAVLVEQPWRVAGRRIAPAPARLPGTAVRRATPPTG